MRSRARGLASELMATRPDSVRAACQPEEILRRVHGVEVGETFCEDCGTIVTAEHYPSSDCVNCGKPFPRRCGTVGCEALVEPIKHRSGEWIEPPPRCAPCNLDSGRQERAELLARPADKGGIPDDLRGAAGSGFWGAIPQRKNAIRVLGTWLDAGIIRRHPVTAVHVYGPPGTGKSTLVARFAMLALMRGLVLNFQWRKEREILQAFKTSFTDGLAGQHGRAIMAAVEGAPLLIVDEVFHDRAVHYVPATEGSNAEGIEPTRAQVWMGEMLAERFERGRPTLCASNEPPFYAHFWGAAMHSRWEGAGAGVEVPGEDLRQRIRRQLEEGGDR